LGKIAGFASLPATQFFGLEISADGEKNLRVMRGAVNPEFWCNLQFCVAQSWWPCELKKTLIHGAQTEIPIECAGRNLAMTEIRIRNFHKSAQGIHNSKV
jgi:hypothetical protein